LSSPFVASQPVAAPEGATGALLEIPTNVHTQLVSLDLAMVYPILGEAGEGTEIFSSDDGRSLLVSWSNGDGWLHYCLGTQGSWHETSSVRLDEVGGLAGAMELLQRLIDHY
jgi:hypothetical protein